MRRKWIVLAAVVVVPVAAYVLASRQQPHYQSTASVATKEGNLAALVSGIPDTSYYEDPTRLAQTQIALAETPSFAQHVLDRAGIKDMSPGAVLGSTSIFASPVADLMYFTVTDTDSVRAGKLANAFAKQYTIFRAELDTQSYREARAGILKRAAQLKTEGDTGDANSLLAKAQQLTTFQALNTSNAVIADTAGPGVQISPRPKRDALFGLALGIVLGIGLAFLRDGLDLRIRGADDILRRTGLPLLARIPEPPRKLQRDEELVMFKQPTSVEAEAFRMLRTNLEFAGIDQDIRSLMITSALEKEGKSTTIANLAVVFARSGQRVALVDLDLRRPRIDKFFKLQGQPGLTNVVLGHSTLDEATAHIEISTGEHEEISRRRERANGNGHGYVPIEGALDVIPSGPIPPDPGEFVSTAALSRLLDTLHDRYDLVLIDAPPVLRVGDALTLASKASALVVVTRLPGMKRPILNELRRVLATCPTRALGFVLTGSGGDERAYGQGYYYNYKQRRTRGREPEQVT
jgi:Mrp family chromosome partitioning ATPase/capsular polysaccharide biosynthesis protein